MTFRLPLFLIAILALALTVVVGRGSAAPGSPGTAYRVVFDVSVPGTTQWEGVVRNIENVRSSLGEKNVEIEVVVYGKALPFLQKTNTTQQEKLQTLAQGGVRFVACENTMQRMKVTREALFPFVRTVDSGAAELVRNQHAGWSYLKPGG